MTGFLLGLANGTTCLALCAPVLVPYMVAEGRGPVSSIPLLGRFLLGRLLGYLLFGAAAGVVGSLLLASGALRQISFGVAYLGLAALLVVYGFGSRRRPASQCAAGGRVGSVARLAGRWPEAAPLLLGFLTGVNLCPPFALALAGAVESGSLAGSVWFFLTFFAGTSVFFLPLPGLGGLRRFEALRVVARLAAGVVGAYYLYRALILIHGGFVGR